MPNIVVAHKKRLIVLTSVLLVLATASIFILYNINRQMKLDYIKSSVNLNQNQVVSSIDKPFYIDLPIDPTSGYLWQADFDQSVLKLNNTSYNQKRNNAKLEDLQTFEFQALQKKETSISFKSVRSWETNNPKETITYKVTIK